MTRVFFCAGESSGDLHGANLIRALRAADPEVQCEGIGGTRMAEAGMQLHFDLAGRAIMGVTEVLKSFSFIRRLFYETVARLRDNRPDALVLIDYPGFNLRLAKRAKALGVPVVYYISPQVWAWKKGRVHTLAKLARKMLVILPFEKPLYDEAGLDCSHVGHPLLDHIASIDLNDTYAGDCTIGILPGSRAQEIAYNLPVMLDVARGIREKRPEARFVTPCVDAARAAQVEELKGDFPLEVVQDAYYDLLHGARFCLVSSGTATVENMLFKVPMIVMYRLAGLTYFLARFVVRVDAIAMVNILADRKIVPEFVQHEATVENMLPVALELIEDTPARAEMLEALEEVKRSLGGPGASKKAADEILKVLREGGHG